MGKSTTTYEVKIASKSVDFEKTIKPAAEKGEGGFASKSPFYNGDKIVIKSLDSKNPKKTFWNLGTWKRVNDEGKEESGNYYVLSCTLNGHAFDGVSPALFGRRGIGDDHEDFALGNIVGKELADKCNTLGGQTFVYWSRAKKEGKGRIGGFLTETQYKAKIQSK
jgi:hypothetical protein